MTTPIPPVRGTLTEHRPLSDLTWLRAGGPADLLFQPADADDLQTFLAALPQETPVFPLGVGSNLIVRDGGIRGVVIRLGRGFNAVTLDSPGLIRAGAAALDAHVARRAAQWGVDLAFLRTIPGAIGGAVRMNAGCYGRYTADIVREVTAITRQGDRLTLTRDDIAFAYRSTDLPPDTIITEALLEGPQKPPAEIEAAMEDALARRAASQPVKDRTAGSTFRNPAGYSSTGQPDDPNDLKAWKLIDDAGLRGFRHGGAKMSEMHPNFLVNESGATATELEDLGELVRSRVLAHSGIQLEWEIMRVGEHVKPTPPGQEN